MSLFSGRIVLILIVIISVLGFSLGYLHINRDAVKCFDKRHWESTGWRTIFSISKLEFRYRDWNYDCDTKYDPKEMKVNDPAIYR